jgi:hypothetical protein
MVYRRQYSTSIDLLIFSAFFEPSSLILESDDFHDYWKIGKFDTGWNFKHFLKNIYIFNVRNNHRRIDRGGIGGAHADMPPQIFYGRAKIHASLEIIELLYVCENYGILGGDFLVCPVAFFISA